MATTLFNRMMMAFRAGMQFSGKRNLYHVFGYPQRLTTDHLYSKYKRQDLTSRVVNMAPEEMWSQTPTITEPSDVQDKWQAFVARHAVYDRLIQADKLCAFGPFSVLWLGLKGNIDSPARKIESLDDILYVQAFGGDSVKIKELEDNTSSPRYGLPLTYEIQIGEQVRQQTKTVHYSRVIHIVDRPLQGQLFGEPRLAQVYNVLEDILKMTGGSAELFWLTANRGMQVDVDKEMQLSEEDGAALSDELDEFQHQLRRYIRTRGVKITNLGGDVADPRGVFETLMSVLAGTTSIPQRILMGSEAGQLASEQDRANWAEYINRRRSTFAEPWVLRPTLRRLGELSYLPVDTWEKAKFEWPEAFHMNPVEEATAIASKARALVNAARRNQFGDPIASKEEARKMLGLPEKVPSGHSMPDPATVPAPQPGANPDNPDNPDGGNSGQDGDSTSSTSSNPSPTEAPGQVGKGPNASQAEATVTVAETKAAVMKVSEGLEKLADRVTDLANREITVQASLNVPEGSIKVHNEIHTPEVTVPVELRTGDTHVHPAEVTVPVQVNPAEVHVSPPDVKVDVAPAQVTVAPAEVTVNVEAPEVTIPVPQVTLGETHVHATLQAPPAGTKVVTAQRMPDGTLKGEITTKPQQQQ